MAKETKEQRELRRAAEEHAVLVEHELYLKTIPKRLADAKILAIKVGMSVDINLGEDGPIVHFVHFYTGSDDDGSFYNFDGTYTYQSAHWELEHLEEHLDKLKQEQDACIARRNLAKTLFDKFTAEEKAALKENIHWLS
jgi:hypothetical protein